MKGGRSTNFFLLKFNLATGRQVYRFYFLFCNIAPPIYDYSSKCILKSLFFLAKLSFILMNSTICDFCKFRNLMDHLSYQSTMACLATNLNVADFFRSWWGSLLLRISWEEQHSLRARLSRLAKSSCDWKITTHSYEVSIDSCDLPE